MSDREVSMSDLNDDILERLRQTIENWSGEVTGARDSLNHQIVETRTELNRLVTLIQKQAGDPAVTQPDTVIKLALLQEELDELKQKRKQERRDSQQLRLDYAVIQNKLHMASAALESVLSENEALKASGDGVSALKDAVTHAADAHEQSQGKHDALDEQDAASSERVEALQQDLDSLRAEYETLTEKHSTLATNHERTMAELDASRNEITAVERRSHQLNEDQEALQLQVSRLQGRIVEKEKEIASLQGSLEESAQDSGLREENDALRDELETLRASFQQQAVTLEQHIKSIQEFQEREVEFVEREDMLREEIAALKARLEQPAETSGLDERERALEEKEQHIQEATQWVRDIESAAITVQQNLDSLRENMLNRAAEKGAAAEAGKAALQAELDEQRALNEAHHETIEALRREIEQRISGTAAVAKGHAATVAELREQLAARAEGESEEIASLRREIETRIAGTAAVAAASRERIQTLQAELEEQQSLNDSQTKKIRSLRAEIAERDENVPPDLSVDLDARTEELRKAQAHIAELEEKLKAEQEEAARLRAQTTEGLGEVVQASPFDAFDEHGQQRAIGEILLDAEVITETQLFNALVEQDRMPNRRIGSILLEQGLIQEDTVAKVLASQLRLDYVDLDEAEFQPEALATLNGRSATHHMSVPLRVDGDVLVVAMANPLDQIALEELERATGKHVETVVAPLSDITAAIVRNYSTDFREDPRPQAREESLQSAED